MYANGDLDALGLNEHDLAQDPTMASCCIQDLRNQRKGAALRQKLREVDVSEARLDMQASLFAPGPHAEGVHEHASCSESDVDSADEGELHDLRVKRMQELQIQAQAAVQAQARGHGSLVDITEAQLLDRLESSSYSVSHLAVEGYEPCSELDEILASLAYQYKGTLFLRAVVSRSSKLRQQLQLQALPGLVCSRDGTLVGRVPFSQFSTPEEVVEEEVVACLRRLGVLRTAQQPRAGRPQGGPQAGGSGVEEDSDAGVSSDGDEDEKAASLRNAPCEVCGRRYPHEHVKAVYRGQRSSDEEDEE